MKQVLNRDNKPTAELRRVVEKTSKGVKFKYTEVYYLDYAVDENTGKIDSRNKVAFYSSDQIDRNLKASEKGYQAAKEN